MKTNETRKPGNSLRPGILIRPVLVVALFSLLALFTIRAADYPTTVLSDHPAAYYRLNDPLLRTNLNLDSGSLGAAANATNLNVLPFPGALAGEGNLSQFFNSTARSIIPWNAALNPTNTLPFSVEAWFYPSSDQINGGQSVINNRYSYSDVDRQGWVIFQRSQDTTYSGAPGNEGVGWDFRMYVGSGSNSGLDVVSQVPYQIGKWTHIAVVYDPVQVTNATVTMYVDGVAANTNIWAGEGPGYVANTNDHDSAEAVNGPSGIAFGSYNNTQPGSNPYFGAVDEFAFYATKLSPEQILAHYQNGTNSARAVAYPALIQADNPAAYLRLDELAPGPDIANNLGNLENGGTGTNSTEVVHPTPSALVGQTDDGSFGYHLRNGNSTTDIPWLADNNPDASLPFSFAAWFRPTSGQLNPGAAPVNNRYVSSGNRTGWVIFQRAPDESQNIGDGVGWNFRMFSGTGSSGQDIVTGVPYTLGEWQQVVVTWTPGADTGNGDGSWSGTLTAYVDGAATATNAAAIYKANTNPTEDETPPADLAIGGYNAASGLGSNAFEGDIDEVAIYNNYILTPDQILAQYQTATNSHPDTNYATLVLTAAYDGAGTQRSMPATYFRFNDPARYPATNQGTLGFVAGGSLVVTTNDAAGPQPPAFPGFEAGNLAASLDGVKSWINLNNPSGLNISNQIALEAWINPGLTQGSLADILAHGTNAGGAEVFLRIDAAGNYAVGSSDGAATHDASAPVPAGDLGGGNWIYLVGTYDGANWNLFRNGALLATKADAVGAVAINDANWAVGSTGNGWDNYFTGIIDEPAIYDHSLTPSQIQAHYAAARGGSGTLFLTINLVGDVATLTWSSGTLQASDSLGGTYADVSAATSPYTVPSTSAIRFYSLR